LHSQTISRYMVLITTYNLARMNILLHGLKDSEFEIHHGDTLKNEWDILREPNPANHVTPEASSPPGQSAPVESPFWLS
jgi:hypothetical protein